MDSMCYDELKVLMPGCKLNFDCRVSPCLPPLFISSVDCNLKTMKLPVRGSQIQSCFPVCVMLSKMQ